eukprot:824048-Amphidinium_carterae.1
MHIGTGFGGPVARTALFQGASSTWTSRLWSSSEPRSAWTGKRMKGHILFQAMANWLLQSHSLVLPLGNTMPVFSQIIFKGETPRVVPGSQVPEHMCLDHSTSSPFCYV